MKPKSSKKPKKELKALASRVAALCMEHGFTQYDTAEFLKINQSAYHRKEAGIHHFQIEELILLAELFHIPFWEFFWNEQNESCFEKFAIQKGYIPAEVISKKLERLELELSQKEGIITELKKDKVFLRCCLYALQNDMEINEGGKT